MKMRKILSGLLAMAMVLSLGGCQKSGTLAGSAGTDVSAPGSTDISALKIGVMVPQTGYPSAAKAYSNGIALAAEEINAAGGVLGHQLELVVEDMGTTPDIALNAFNKIAAQGDVSIIMGCALSACALTIESRLPEEKIILISGATSPKLAEIDNQYFFRGRTSDEYTTRIAMSFLNNNLEISTGATIGMLYDSTDFGVGAYDVLVEICAEEGINLVAEAFNADDTDVSTQVLKLKEANVDAIAIWTSSGFPVAARAVYEQGITCPVIASPAVSNASVLTTCTNWIEGWYTVTDICLEAPIDGLSEFVEKHNARFDPSELSYDALTTYSWVYLLKDAIERAGSIDTQDIIDALNQTKDFQGLNGIYTKFNTVEFLNNAIIGQIKDGAVTYIDRVEAPVAD